MKLGLSTFCCVGAVVLGTVCSSLRAAESIPPEMAANLPELWFPVGEELLFQIRWGRIAVGSSRVATAWTVRDGRVLLAIRYRTLTNRVFSKIYPMNDVGESLIDPETFLPVRFSFRKQRWRTACDDVVTFDYERSTARIESHCNGTVSEVAIDRSVRDIIGFMYWMRQEPLPAGMETMFRVMTNEGVAELLLQTSTETEVVHLPEFGAVDCLRLDPVIDLADLLVEKGELTLWVARDRRQLGVQLAVKAPLLKVRARLIGVKGPGEDRWTAAGQEDGALE